MTPAISALFALQSGTHKVAGSQVLRALLNQKTAKSQSTNQGSKKSSFSAHSVPKNPTQAQTAVPF